MRAFALALASFTLATPAFADASAPATNLLRASFRVEQLFQAEVDAEQFPIWLVSTVDPARRARLPEISLSDVGGTGATSGNAGYKSELSISPDERFIFRDQKLFHGANAAWLYTRVHGLEFRPAAHARVDRAVKRFFARRVGGDDIDQMGIVEFVAWGDDGKSLVVSLRGREVAGYDVVGWQCTVDLANGRVRDCR